jgi:hypothetical protein
MTTPTPTSWTVHLAAAAPRRAAVAVGVILLALMGVALLVPENLGVGGRLAFIGAAAAALLGAVADFLFPVTYTLDAAGAHQRVLGRHRLLPWSRVQRVYLSRIGIQLSPLAAPSWREGLQSLTLRAPDPTVCWTQVRAWLAAAGVEPDIREES